ncbi:relaxase/mobilization nuclease domain protein, partial [Campylobacter fetus subsp. testudinum]
MLVKFFASKSGGGVGSINYLLDKRVNQGTAKILQGDENLTRDLINSMSQKHKTCVGCLSFEENNIDENSK